MTDGLPLFVAGDLFDRWDSSPEVVNLALQHLPKCYAVPGQHDLPHHRYEDIKKSAYYSLVLAGIVKTLKPGHPTVVSDELVVTGFPWGFDVTGPDPALHPSSKLNLAVVHGYCWKEGHEHPGATKDTHVTEWEDNLAGFDAAVFGDNHHAFRHHNNPGCPEIFNHGTFIRRRTDERELDPKVGFLLDDGGWETAPTRLDEKWEDIADLAEPLTAVGLDAEELLELLATASTGVLSFRDTLTQWMKRNKVGSVVEGLIIGWLEKSRGVKK